MLRSVLICGFFHVVSSIFCQSKNDCDEIAAFFRQHIYTSEQYGEFDQWKDVRKIRKCISNDIVDINSCENFSLNLSNLARHVKNEKDRRKILIYMIKIQPHLKGKLKGSNKQIFLSTVTTKDENIAKRGSLKMIRQNFGLDSYLKVLLLFSKSIHGNQKKEIEELFRNKDSLSVTQKSTIWQSALLLAIQNDTMAENYLIKILNEEIQVFGRMSVNKFSKDFAATKNRRIMDYIIDEFLMSDYAFWDLDYGHSDFGAAENILRQAVDSPIFKDALKFFNDEEKRKLFIRQWFKENRHTYKIKP